MEQTRQQQMQTDLTGLLQALGLNVNPAAQIPGAANIYGGLSQQAQQAAGPGLWNQLTTGILSNPDVQNWVGGLF